MHHTTGHWKVGLLLSLATVMLWGVLPIALKMLLASMDANTITWYRFLAASIVLAGFLYLRGSLPRFNQLEKKHFLLLAVALFGLSGNYILYLLGLNYITPGAAQVVIQSAPVLLLIGGVIFFKERFSLWQWLGLVILAIGLLLFFNHRLKTLLLSLDEYTVGVLLILAAGVAWAAYALAQKQLLKVFSSEQIMFVIYVGGAILFFPVSTPNQLLDLNSAALALLIFASLNTLLAYGAFAEALDHWEASRVSAVLALTPLMTLFFMSIVNHYTDWVEREPLNALSIFGACVVVAGSMMTALAGQRKSLIKERLS